MRARAAWALLFLALLAARLCHLDILWAEENLPLAAAVQMVHGKVLYRDIWFDKPPLVASVCLLWGAHTGLPLRVAGALFVFCACLLSWRFAREKWGPREGALAAALFAFFLTFGIPSAVIPLAADLLLVVPHLAAVYLAWRGRAFWSGVLAGTGLLFNSKALFVAAACALWVPRSLPSLAAGFLVPNLAALGWFAVRGSLGAYIQQVWQLGVLYAGSTFLQHPVRDGILKTANWLGFHAALAAGSAWFFARGRDSDRWRFAGWTLVSLAAVTLGWRFFPRYYFQLLPVAVLLGARGIVLMGRKGAIVCILLVAPLVRFGPRYVQLAADMAAGRQHAWVDILMDQDSRQAAGVVRKLAAPGDTLFVWGFRPDIYAYTRLPAASRFLESQPLNGVLADRHLFQSDAIAPDWTRANRVELARSRPTFVLDGLSLYNPSLAMPNYPELKPWLERYTEVARTRTTIVYRRKDK